MPGSNGMAPALPSFWPVLCAITDMARVGKKEAVLLRRLFLAVLVSAGAGLAPAVAQEDLNRGKTAPQLFASDCADCHRNPRLLTRRENARVLAEFLRVHYTASRENAAAIAGYLASLPPPPRTAPARPAAKPGAVQERKPAAAAQPGEKPAEAAPAKPAETPPVPPAAVPPTEPAPPPAPAAPAADPQ
jgi:hypothetical protein